MMVPDPVADGLSRYKKVTSKLPSQWRRIIQGVLKFCQKQTSKQCE